MSISKHHHTNFETLLRAAEHGHLALLECKDANSGEIVAAIVAVSHDGNDFSFTPFATMIEGNPYEQLLPPNPDGGFYEAQA